MNSPAGRSGVSALQAVEKASHCQCPPQTLHNRSTDRATERKGKERAGSVWETKGDSKEEDKRKEEIRGVSHTQHWSDGGWEEPMNPMAYGGGREYANMLKSQEQTEGYTVCLLQRGLASSDTAHFP